jgi:hypothetical protein
MNIKKITQLVTITILFFISSTIAFGQKLAPKERKTEPNHTIFSKIRGSDY